jgi:hypothetical protein
MNAGDSSMRVASSDVSGFSHREPVLKIAPERAKTTPMAESCPTFEKIHSTLTRLNFSPSNPFTASSSPNSCRLYRGASESIFITPHGFGDWEIAANSARTVQMLGDELSRLGLSCTPMGTSLAVKAR